MDNFHNNHNHIHDMTPWKASVEDAVMVHEFFENMINISEHCPQGDVSA